MSQQYSTLEQWLINQELTTLNNHFQLLSENILEYLTNLKTKGFCKESEDFTYLQSDEEELNRFTVEISLIYVKTTDTTLENDTKEFLKINKNSRQPYFTIPRPIKNLFFLTNDQSLENDILQYQKILLNHYDRLLQENLIEEMFFQVTIRGPVLYRIYKQNSNNEIYEFIGTNEDEYFDESMTGLLVHPFAKLPRMHVSNEEKPISKEVFSYKPTSNHEELFDNIIKELEKIVVVKGDKVLFTVAEEIYPLFRRWIADRQTQDNINQQINQLYPMLTSLRFLTQLQEWTDLGKQIIKETELLNNQIHVLTQISTFDTQTIELLLQEAWKLEAKDVLTREEILDRWVVFLQKRGDTRSHDYIKKNILRPRLKTVLEKIEHSTELDSFTFEISKDTSERSGKPSTLFKLKETSN